MPKVYYRAAFPREWLSIKALEDAYYDQAIVHFSPPHFANCLHAKPLAEFKAILDRFDILLPRHFDLAVLVATCRSSRQAARAGYR